MFIGTQRGSLRQAVEGGNEASNVVLSDRADLHSLFSFAMEILIHPDLPGDMVQEILDHCEVTALAWVAHVNHEWADKVRARLEAHLVRGITFHTYHQEEKIYLNWTGPLTFGSAFFRGLRVHLHAHAGTEVDLSGRPASVELDDEWSVEDEKRVDLDTAVFWDDFILLRVSHPDKILDGSHEIAYIQTTFSLDILERKLADREDPEFWSSDPKELVAAARAHLADHALGGICFEPLLSEKYFASNDGDAFLFINNLGDFFSEIRRIKAIGERHRVDFEWI